MQPISSGWASKPRPTPQDTLLFFFFLCPANCFARPTQPRLLGNVGIDHDAAQVCPHMACRRLILATKRSPGPRNHRAWPIFVGAITGSAPTTCWSTASRREAISARPSASVSGGAARPTRPFLIEGRLPNRAPCGVSHLWRKVLHLPGQRINGPLAAWRKHVSEGYED